MAGIQWVSFTAEQVSSAPRLEPALEALLRSHSVHENVITALRCQDILTRSVFCELDTDVAGLQKTAKEAFGIDVNADQGAFLHKKEMAKIVAAWKEGRLQSDTKAKLDAVTRAHGEPVSRLPEDWDSVMEAFLNKYGKDIPEDRLPSQSYFESFEEKLNGNRLKPETLAQVISQEEEETQEQRRPEPSRQLHLTLDANLTVQTKRRYMSSMPVSVEDLRTKYAIMSNMWLLGQMRQPGRSLYADLTKETFPNFLEILLSKKNFMFRRELPDKTLAGPDWKDCLEYEFQLRKEAYRLTREQGIGIQSALHTALSDPQHRMEHWITFLTVANARTERDNDLKNELAEIRKELAQLRNQRSRSPRGKQVLAIKDAAPGSSGKAKTKNSKGRGKSGRGTGRGAPVLPASKGKGSGKNKNAPGKDFLSFESIYRSAEHLFHPDAKTLPGICWRFQRNQCKDAAKCTRKHICIGCGKANVGYDSCGCLQTKIA